MRPRCVYCEHSRVRHDKRGAGWNRLWCGHPEVETWAPHEACWRFERAPGSDDDMQEGERWTA